MKLITTIVWLQEAQLQNTQTTKESWKKEGFASVFAAYMGEATIGRGWATSGQPRGEKKAKKAEGRSCRLVAETKAGGRCQIEQDLFSVEGPRPSAKKIGSREGAEDWEKREEGVSGRGSDFTGE